MRGNRNRDTEPELRLRRALFRRGLRYRVCVRPLPGLRATADIVFPRRHVAIFVDGCFWHGCPAHLKRSKTNVEYWDDKIRHNRERDATVDDALGAAGWTVLRFWQHDDPEDAAEVIATTVRRVGKAGT